MKTFDHISPTKIFFGKNREDEVGSILASFSAKNILLIYGGKSIYLNNLYDRIINSLSKADIKCCELGGIRPNPTRSVVAAGIEKAKNGNVDYILAVGGGSVIDTAKSIACGVYYDGDAFDFNLYLATPKKALPVGVILTISASGSELSSSCVISDDANGIKQGFNSDLVRPQFVIENPELTFSVSRYQTACGIVDIISHSLERFFIQSDRDMFCDALALALIKNTISNGRTAMNNPNDYESRANLMIASSYSHSGLTSLGKIQSMPIHKIEHALSGSKPSVAHGAGLAVLIPAWMQSVFHHDLAKFARFGRDVFDIRFASDEESAIIGIRCLGQFFKEIGMPTTLRELGFLKSDIPILANKITQNGTRVVGHSVKPLTKEELEIMLSSCF